MEPDARRIRLISQLVVYARQQFRPVLGLYGRTEFHVRFRIHLRILLLVIFVVELFARSRRRANIHRRAARCHKSRKNQASTNTHEGTIHTVCDLPPRSLQQSRPAQCFPAKASSSASSPSRSCRSRYRPRTTNARIFPVFRMFSSGSPSSNTRSAYFPAAPVPES